MEGVDGAPPNGSRDVTLNLKADGNTLTGTISGRQGETPIKDRKIKGAHMQSLTRLGGDDLQVGFQERY
jgi:hypothetical protein